MSEHIIDLNFVSDTMAEFENLCNTINHADVDYRRNLKELASQIEEELGIDHGRYMDIFSGPEADDYVYEHIRDNIRSYKSRIEANLEVLAPRHDRGECITFRDAILMLTDVYRGFMIEYYYSKDREET